MRESQQRTEVLVIKCSANLLCCAHETEHTGCMNKLWMFFIVSCSKQTMETVTRKHTETSIYALMSLAVYVLFPILVLCKCKVQLSSFTKMCRWENKMYFLP